VVLVVVRWGKGVIASQVNANANVPAVQSGRAGVMERLIMPHMDTEQDWVVWVEGMDDGLCHPARTDAHHVLREGRRGGWWERRRRRINMSLFDCVLIPDPPPPGSSGGGGREGEAGVRSS